MKQEIIIATRGSRLALWQAEYIKNLIESYHKDITCHLNIIKTSGDKILDKPLAKIGGKGLFVKEIENALLENQADLAVHSMKDVPIELPPTLTLYKHPKGEDYRDAFLSLKYNSLKELPIGAKVGTSSLRRKAQILELRSDLEIVDLRGNVETRIRKMHEGEYEGIILAYAGLKRLEITDDVKEIFSCEEMLPAVCQGILGIEIRENDSDIKNILSFMGDDETTIRATCERAFLRKMQGGCQLPIACFARLEDNKIYVKAAIYNPNNKSKVEAEETGDKNQAEQIGINLAEKILAQDKAQEILREIYNGI